MKLLILASLLFSSMAFAGKAERDYMSTTGEPAVKAASESFQKNCGCPLKIDVKWDSFKNVDQMSGAMRTPKSITENSAEYCKDAGSKKAMCAMKTLELGVSENGSINFAGNKMVITTNTLGDTSYSWDAITKTVDK
jgi:hypothetical protein